jgi:hypothetical protein
MFLAEEVTEISSLEGFGGNVKKQKPLERKVSNEHNYPKTTIPKSLLESLGLMATFLKGELYIEYSSINPLKNEIKVRFTTKKNLPKQSP